MAASRPQKTALLVAQRIVADINDRGIQVGERLPPEHQMLEDYEVGRGTLRESLRFLELQGVIKLKPGPSGGPVVQQPDSSGLVTALSLVLQFHNAPFQTIIEARVALEPHMARLAAERMSAEAADELGQIVAEERAVLGDEPAFLQQTRKFHTAIARGSDNALFGLLFFALVDLLDGSAMGVEYPKKQRVATVDIHTDIHGAIADGDLNKTYELMETHMTALAQYTKRKYSDALAAPIVWRA